MSSNAAIMIIGDEILSGRTADLNINWLAKELNTIGIHLSEVRIIADEKNSIVECVNLLRRKFSYVFSCGGIGPTHDDITTESMAAAFDLGLERHKEAMDKLGAYYSANNIEFNAARQKMATIPKGAKLIPNSISIAPGFNLENVYVFAGVPQIMQSMFLSIAHELKGGCVLFNKSISCSLGEGMIAEAIEKIENKHPTLKIGSYPYYEAGGFRTTIVLRSKQKDTVLDASKEVLNAIKEKGGEATPLD